MSEPDRLVLPFAMIASAQLLESVPRHETAHAGLLTDILDIVHGSSVAPQGAAAPARAGQLSPAVQRARDLRLLSAGSIR